MTSCTKSSKPVRLVIIQLNILARKQTNMTTRHSAVKYLSVPSQANISRMNELKMHQNAHLPQILCRDIGMFVKQ